MSYAQLGEHVVASGEVRLPNTGRPTADLRLALDGSRAPALGAQLELNLEGNIFRTTVVRSGSDGEFAQVRVVGGTHGLARFVGAKDYDNLPSANIVRDLLAEVGERAGEINLPNFPRWTRLASQAYLELGALLDRCPGHNWRMGPDGAIWAGVDAWPDHPEDAVVTNYYPTRGAYTLLQMPSLRPGVTLYGRWVGERQLLGRVGRVVHCIGPTLRTEVWIEG